MVYTFRKSEDDEIIYGKIEADTEMEAVEKVRRRDFTDDVITKREKKDPNVYDTIGVWIE